MSLFAGLAAATPAPAQTPRPAGPAPTLTKAVTGVTKVTGKKITVPNPAAVNAVPAAVTWPAATTGTITLATPPQTQTKAAAPAEGATSRATGMPVWARAISAAPVGTSPSNAHAAAPTWPQSIAVTVADRQAAAKSGVDGVILSAHTTRGAGSVRIGLDYGGFADAFGGNYGARLHLVTLPACALTTPQRAACRTQTPLVSTNNPTDKSVSAVVTLPATATAASNTTQPGTSGPVVLAATAGTTSAIGGGTYAATSLKPSGSWTAGGSSGSFTYSYPITVPSAASSLAPSVALSYDSGSVDGQTASTQTQSSWIGDGWSGPENYIERSFAACSDSPEGSAAPSSTSDDCYDGPVLTLSLNGSTTSLVPAGQNAAGQSIYRAAQDDGEVITQVTGSSNGTGTYNADYWTITQRDGTTYEFGRNELPGWTSGKPTTNSVDSEPVYSAHSGDPCYNAAGFTSSVCTMAYRWNLDYVTDVHHNALAYYYQQNTNYYGEDNGAKDVSYIRDSYLDHIDYGFTDPNAYAAPAPDDVMFTPGDRCVSGTCDPLSTATAGNWQDVPYDLNCAANTTCAAYGPSHWSTVALAAISTRQYNTGTGKYQPIDSWALTHTMPATGDGTKPTLWLASIQHTGSDTSGGGSTTPIALPAVSFAGMQLQNRVDVAADPSTNKLVPLYRYRISAVTSETGSVTGVEYSPESDCPVPVTLAPATNTDRCYPMSWMPPDYEAPIIDWFHKYVVTSVTQADKTGGMPTMFTGYTYSAAGGAWHYDDNEVVEPQYRTYGQWRGYGEVQVRTGQGTDPQTLTDTTYYRGMDGDTLPGNTTRTVTLTDSQGGQHTDSDALAGDTLETTSSLGDGGPIDHSTINSYWVSPPTATRTRTGMQPLTANLTGQVETWSRQAITDGGTSTWRDTETDNAYDPATGLLTYTDTHGDLTHPEQATCTATSYALANTSLNLVGLPAEVEVDAGNCGGANPNGASAPTASQINTLTAPTGLSRPTDVISDTRTLYDNPTQAQTWPQPTTFTWPQPAPTAGDASVVQNASGYTSGAFTYQTSKAMVYDSYGRPTATYDANGNKTTTAYTTTAGLTTATTVTNPLGQATTTTLDPARALTLTSTDPNKIVSTEQYDTLGRLTSVWTSSRPTSSPANDTYSYAVSATGPTVVTTTTLNDESGHYSSTALFDSLLRPVQTQTPTPQGGRLVTNTVYDTRGWVVKKNNPYWDSTATPGPDLITAPDNEVPNQDRLTLDGLGRTVVDESDEYAKAISTTTTVYNGDRTTVIPPTGGTTTATVTDALGRTTALDQYTTAPTLTTPASPFTGIYSVTGGTLQATTTGYNHQGRPATLTDPAGNTWTTSYNLLGQTIAKTDPDTGNSAITYDPDGNVTSTTDGDGHTLSYSYDALNRKTAQYDGATTSAPKLASWTYDGADATPALTDAIGQLTSESSYTNVGGNTYAYTEASAGFDNFGNSLGTTVTIPSNEGALAGSYTFSHQYTPTLGLLELDIDPATGSLPAEYVGPSYTSPMDLVSGVGSDFNNYSSGTIFDAYRRPVSETLNYGTDVSTLNTSYDVHTGKLTNTQLSNNAPSTVDSTSYAYDLSGNLTSETDERDHNTALTETQCYGYDTLDRLHQAWTATDSCAADPATNSGATVGDPIANGAYWTTWSFDPLGDRTSETDHALPGSTGGDATTTYTYPTAGANQPHALASTSTTGPAGTSSTAYRYDAVGNTTQRTVPTDTQGLTWTDTEKLATVTSPAGTTAYTYNADGSELLRHDPGSTTLFLPNEEIVLNTSTNAITGTRFYPLPGGGEAVRTGSGTQYGYELTDQHGTATIALDNTAQVATWRQSTPYGGPRGTTPNTWPDQHGFLNKPTDSSTGLVDVGARSYDPSTGRFISIDPVLDPTNPQSMTGYSYADDNPTTGSDPTGLMMRPDPGGGGTDCQSKAECDSNGYQNVASQQANANAGSSGTGKAGSKKNYPVVHISPHVVINLNDPLYRRLQTDWNQASTQFNGLSEYGVWTELCTQNPADCAGEMGWYFGSQSFINGGLSFTDGTAPAGGSDRFNILISSAGGVPFIRSLFDPKSMIGASKDEIQAMLPQSWLDNEKPVRTGTGVRWLSPKNGSYGSVRYYPDGQLQVDDPLHQGPYADVQVGGTKYRVAAEGNDVLDDPNIPSLQIVSTGPVGPLEPRAAPNVPDDVPEVGGGGE
ncbi:MAG TPA: RHS repeat-associated core domain-containing protein [Pseudonocardiaceae bacterium]|nr:RHS repeat-associated core domain-containing protein [Pseudonocardiaceae bacterium]